MINVWYLKPNECSLHSWRLLFTLSQMLHEKFVEYFVSTNKVIILLKNNTIHSKTYKKPFIWSNIRYAWFLLCLKSMLAVCRRRDLLDIPRFSENVTYSILQQYLQKKRWTNLKMCSKVWRLLTSLVCSKEVKNSKNKWYGCYEI